MKVITGEVERLRRSSLFETAKNILDIFQQIRPYSAPVVAFMEPFQAAMLETPDHQGLP